MQRGKISFGKINLNLAKPVEKPAAKEDETKETCSSSSGGFKKIDKHQMQKQIEDVTEDLESQRLKEVMGLTGFGRKAAKVFDINVSGLLKFVRIRKRKQSKILFLYIGANCQSQGSCTHNASGTGSRF